MSDKHYEDTDIVRTALNEYYVADLRAVAMLYHGGQWSSLYSFGSSGMAVPGLASEALKCAELADTNDDYDFECEGDMLRAIATLEPTDEDEQP